MTEVDLKNKEIIKGLVQKHWSLDESSLKLFNERIENPVMDSLYSNLLESQGSKDGRIRFPIPTEKMETFDSGWSIFKRTFHAFIGYYNVSYENFRTNKVIINKNEIKLRKAMIKFYSVVSTYYGARLCNINYESIFEAEKDVENGKYQLKVLLDFVDRNLESIGTKSFPKNKPLELVISTNFADWFLSSTGQDWTSCLSLESNYSYAYWAGLVGLIIDPNRSMVYITGGDKKTYNGIETDNVITRTWALTGNENDIGILRWYPQQFVDADFINKITGLNFRWAEDSNFESKNAIEEMLYYENGKSCFVYQDNCTIQDDMKYRSGDSGHFYKEKGNDGFEEGDALDYEGGLHDLIEGNNKLSSYYYHYDGDNYVCDNCGDSVSEGEEVYFDGEYYCDDCYHEVTNECDECGNRIHQDDALITEEGIYCERCHDNLYIECEECGEDHLIEKTIEVEGENFCSLNCVHEYGYSTCNECGDYVHDEDAIEFEGERYHEDCANETLSKCNNCGEWHKKEDVVEIDGSEDEWCKSCIQESVDENQKFFDFESVA